jgi:hypothetical protein
MLYEAGFHFDKRFSRYWSTSVGTGAVAVTSGVASPKRRRSVRVGI